MKNASFALKTKLLLSVQEIPLILLLLIMMMMEEDMDILVSAPLWQPLISTVRSWWVIKLLKNLYETTIAGLHLFYIELCLILLFLQYIPVEFARSNDLTNRECEMIMKDERGRSWPLRLEDNGSHVCIRGFHHFLTANGLKEGVSFVIHLLQNGNNPLMNFHSNLSQSFST